MAGTEQRGRNSERIFLEGPRSRWAEFVFSTKVLFEFIRGFRVLHFVGPCVAVFGSARVPQGSVFYEDARKMGAGLADLGFTVVTGGGPGIMEAANRGARERKGASIGCNIRLPKEQQPNIYMDKWFVCKYFFVRKVLMFKYSHAFVIMPGGMGTLDEFFEALTLIQTHKILDFPIVLFGKKYWEPVMSLFHGMVAAGTIDASDLRYLLFTDDHTEALEHIKHLAMEKYNQYRQQRFHRVALLGE